MLNLIHLICMTLLNLLGFENNHNNPKRLEPQNNKPLIDNMVLLIIISIILIVLFVVICFLFIPGTESGVVRNTINNI